jgi:hypothetical protein
LLARSMVGRLLILSWRGAWGGDAGSCFDAGSFEWSALRFL